VDFAGEFPIQLGARSHVVALWTARFPGTEQPLYLLDCPELYRRPAIYTGGLDDARRFALFCRGVIESCQRMGWAPDVFHCNDWHTALIPLLLRTVYQWDALFGRSRTLLTVHNLGYQGLFPATEVGALGLGEWSHLLDQDDLRAGRLNFLRTGLLYADVITTVSPTYAREIQTNGFGMGLEQLLHARHGSLIGILNGVDYGEWSPETDRFIPCRYSRREPRGKRENKRQLLAEAGLPGELDAPLVGVISRLVAHKGFDLCFDVLPEVLQATDLCLVVLGTGEARYEQFFRHLQQRFARQVAYHGAYSEPLAHRIEAASDMFLMPSLYEPCGLNQMFSLRYGTIPIVRRTGGLADTVEPFDPSSGQGTGIVFEHFDAAGLRWALGQALRLYRLPAAWSRLVAHAMAQDYSWEVQARRYLELYAKLAGG
jgi:starch synthase